MSTKLYAATAIEKSVAPAGAADFDDPLKSHCALREQLNIVRHSLQDLIEAVAYRFDTPTPTRVRVPGWPASRITFEFIEKADGSAPTCDDYVAWKRGDIRLFRAKFVVFVELRYVDAIPVSVFEEEGIKYE